MSTEDKTSPGVQKVMTRLPEGLRERVAHAAALDNRSMNGFIVAVIVEKLDRTDRLDLLLDTLESAAEAQATVTPEKAQKTVERIIKTLSTPVLPGSKVLQ